MQPAPRCRQLRRAAGTSRAFLRCVAARALAASTTLEHCGGERSHWRLCRGQECCAVVVDVYVYVHVDVCDGNDKYNHDAKTGLPGPTLMEIPPTSGPTAPPCLPPGNAPAPRKVGCRRTARSPRRRQDRWSARPSRRTKCAPLASQTNHALQELVRGAKGSRLGRLGASARDPSTTLRAPEHALGLGGAPRGHSPCDAPHLRQVRRAR